MTYSDLVAQWNRKYGEAYTLSPPLLPVIPARTISTPVSDPVARACAEIRALGPALVCDPLEPAEEE